MPLPPVEFTLRVGGIDGVKAALRDVDKTLDMMARASVKTTEQAARQRIRIEQTRAKDEEKLAKQAAKAAESASRAIVKQEEDRARAESRLRNQALRDEQKAFDERIRLSAKAHREQQRMRDQAAREEISSMERVLRAREQRANRIGGIAGRAVQRTLGVVGRVAAIGASLMGGFSIADALQTGISEESSAGQIVRSAAKTGGLGKGDVINAARGAATATGGTTTDALAGLDAFVKKTGDLKEGVDLLQDLAKAAAASGTSLQDMGSFAAEAFNVTGSKAETKASVLAMIAQGKAGAIDIRDLAQYGARITSSATLFEGGTANNIQSFGALAQLAKSKGGAVDAAEASEAAARLFSEIAEHKDKFQALGVKVTGKGGKLRNVEDILVDTLVKTKGDITAIPKLFGRQAGKVETGLATIFNEAGGGGGGVAAVRAALAGGKATMTDEDVAAGVTDRLTETQAKLNIATENFQRAMQDQLLPLMPGLIDQFTQLIPTIQKVVEFFTNHPFAGLAGVVLSGVAIDLAAAGIGAGVKAAIVALIGGGSIPTAATTAATTTASAAAGGEAAAGGGILASLGAAGTAIAAAPLAIAGYLGYRAVKGQDAGEASANALLAQGAVTPEEQKAKLASLQNMLTRVTDRREAVTAFNLGQESNLTGSKKAALNDNEAGGMLKHEAQLRAQFDELSKSLNGANNALASLAAHGTDFGRANPNDPSRAPVQVGR